ncbi:Repeat domain-containing protein [Robiginitalea myxolifaciens]|uniref:Repeat domain-containing protein n=1 Tax=Robiginitalea myxolifaciens TaxID=400055 RepID=A0A1I6FNW2_9FLAO|nr:FG-GAP-like repeat-containing protein [Robiginitalea myxolifaciens]SFR31631.1 Repeat domain-containing protein [Robiginitalea myxolifaciens]
MKRAYCFPSGLSKLICCFLLLCCGIGSIYGQTTFTENAAAFNLDLGTNKDGGHAWADYDGDGDQDVLVLVNSNSRRSYLMRNNGNGTFTNVQPSLVPGMLSDRAERQAAWGDLNNDGRPDFMITSHGNSGGNPSPAALQIFLQNASGTFGDGVGGTAPITVGRNGHTININPLNAEGAGFFDFEGDGDLDIFFDSHNYGIELLRNNYIDHTTSTVVNPPASGLFTHITPGNGSGVVQFGLNQFATDGDYGTAADVDDDGWVDIFMRKRDENDFFLNQGGTFTNGADLAQARNNNKGGNGLWDLDNDGDLDAVWTENDITQIFRNDGPGVWTAMGAGVFPGLPQPSNANSNSSARIDALAGGDIDNDGDIDILLVGNNRSYLYINQLNSPTPAPGVVGSGSPMTFTLDSETFNSSNGEGTTMIDVDDDGDLDIYMNISGTNQLYINNLPAANRNNHLLINVTEDRAANGDTGGFAGRVAIGTNVLIKDCEGNIVSGLRQVAGVFGHGTQQPELVHFGLPLGENETYIIEVRYPNFNDPDEGVTRLIATAVAQPSTIPGTNHFDLSTTDAEIIENVNPPVAGDDLISLESSTSISIQISLFDNDYEPDGEAISIESITQPAVGSVVIDDADAGLVTFTYSAGTAFLGTSFTYTVTDATVSLCPALGLDDVGTVTLFTPCTDPSGTDSDGDGINDLCDEDDDNDGITDCTESQDAFNSYFAWELNNPSGTLAIDAFGDPDYATWVLASSTNMSFSGISASAPYSAVEIRNITAVSLGEALANNDYIEVSFTTENQLINTVLSDITWGWFQPSVGDSYRMSFLISADGFATYEILTHDLNITDDGSGYAVFDLLDAAEYRLDSNTTYTFRAYVFGYVDDSPENYAVFDDLRFTLSACQPRDTDSDTTADHLDGDSDGDGCTDPNEAYASDTTDSDNDGIYGTGSPAVDADGLVTAATYAAPADSDSSSTPDHLEISNVPTISTQPPNTTTCLGCSTSISVTANGANTFQWQVFDGSSWNDISDGTEYSGTTTNTLQINVPREDKNGLNYRVLVGNLAYICGPVLSNTAQLNLQVTGVITNRRITYRVDPN